MLLLPERAHAEQLMNSHFLAGMGCGDFTLLEQVTTSHVRGFLGRLESFRPALDALAGRIDGTGQPRVGTPRLPRTATSEAGCAREDQDRKSCMQRPSNSHHDHREHDPDRPRSKHLTQMRAQWRACLSPHTQPLRGLSADLRNAAHQRNGMVCSCSQDLAVGP
jgi:hypothetical protein